MNLLTVPRRAAALEYRAFRLPATLVETQVVTRFLAEDSVVRLSFEKFLGGLDERAGTLLRDEQLSSRGHALRRRSALLSKAVELESVAEQRAQAAEATRRAGANKGQKARSAALTQEQAAVEAALRKEREDKARAEREAAAQLEAERRRVEQQAAAKKDAVLADLQTSEQQIALSEQARTAQPKAQLDHAARSQADAGEARQRAARLASLAAAEKAKRKA